MRRRRMRRRRRRAKRRRRRRATRKTKKATTKKAKTRNVPIPIPMVVPRKIFKAGGVASLRIYLAPH
jgi:hypothetical protein